MDRDQTPGGAEVTAEGFGVRGPRGWAFRDVTVDAGPGALVAVRGPSGSGRTCLLLALTGRMRADAGHARVAGLPLPGGRAASHRKLAAVRRVSSLGHVPGVTDLDPALTVAEHLREHALLQRRFTGSLRSLLRPRKERSARARERVDAALAAAGLDIDTLPKRERTAVRDLERTESLRLSIALALIDRPLLLAVDDLDLKLSAAERDQVWARLRTIAAAGTTVLAVCDEAPSDAVVVTTGPDAVRDRDGGSAPTDARPEAGPDTGAEPAPTQDTHGRDTDREDPDTSTTGAGPGTAHDEKGAADALAETGRA